MKKGQTLTPAELMSSQFKKKAESKSPPRRQTLATNKLQSQIKGLELSSPKKSERKVNALQKETEDDNQRKTITLTIPDSEVDKRSPS